MTKKIILLLLLTVCTMEIRGQEAEPDDSDKITYELYQYHFDTQLSQYNCRKENGKRVKSVSDKVLQKNLYGIYTAIIPDMQNLAGNTSAFAYSHNADKKTLNVSASFQFKKYPKSFLNSGVYIEGNSGFFDLYSSGSWSNNVAFNIGFSRVLKGTQFLNPKKCEELIPKRREYVDSLLLAYNVKLSKSIEELEKKRDSAKDLLDKLKEQFPTSEKDSIEHKIKQWQKLSKEVKEYKNLLKDSEEEVKNQVASELQKFDTENDNLYGYNVWWFHFGSSLANSTIKIADSLFAGNQRITNYPKIDVNISFMWNWLGKRTLQHARIEGVITRGSFMDDPTLTKGKDPTISYAGGLPEVVYDDRILGNHSDLKKPVWQYTIGAYYANFFLFDKSLGLSARTAYNKAIDNKYTDSYRDNYSVLVGPVFRAAKDDSWAKATFGISAGFQSTPYNEKAKDFFAVQAYIGVPFNAFIKK